MHPNQTQPLKKHIDELPEITQLLDAWSGGDRVAEARLMELVIDELRAVATRILANEYGKGLVDPTELVNEVYLKLLRHPPKNWQSRGKFFGVVGRSMKQVLVDLARQRGAEKRGGNAIEITLVTQEMGAGAWDILKLNDALEALKAQDTRKAVVVELRFFTGLTHREIADELGVAEPTIKRDWRHAKMFLYAHLQRS